MSPMSFFRRHSALIALLMGALAFGACVRNPATHKVHARLLSPEAERKIGLAAKKEVISEYHVFKSTEVNMYVNRVGQKLARVCDRPTVDYDFTILDSDLINAFAVPGGFIFVTRGLLEAVDDESELAMVLGHEIGHVAALHGVQMIQKEMGQNALTILGTIGAALTVGPEAMLMVANTANLFSSLYLLGYSREKELEADNLGLQYMLRAGYDPRGALVFLKKLQALDSEHAQGWDLYFRTHPSTDQRIHIIESMIGTENETPNTPPPQRTVNEYGMIKALLPRVDKSERGHINGLVYVNIKHDLQMKVPSNWVLGFFHPQSLVSFHTLNNEGDGRLQVVALGSSTVNAEQLADQFGQMAGFQAYGGHDVLYPAGYGYLGHFAGVSAGGELLDIRLLALIRYGRGYVIFCGAPPEKSDAYALDLEQILRSLKFG
jgi:predicted Zn-dependent protease